MRERRAFKIGIGRLKSSLETQEQGCMEVTTRIALSFPRAGEPEAGNFPVRRNWRCQAGVRPGLEGGPGSLENVRWVGGPER